MARRSLCPIRANMLPAAELDAVKAAMHADNVRLNDARQLVYGPCLESKRACALSGNLGNGFPRRSGGVVSVATAVARAFCPHLQSAVWWTQKRRAQPRRYHRHKTHPPFFAPHSSYERAARHAVTLQSE